MGKDTHTLGNRYYTVKNTPHSLCCCYSLLIFSSIGERLYYIHEQIPNNIPTTVLDYHPKRLDRPLSAATRSQNAYS